MAIKKYWTIIHTVSAYQGKLPAPVAKSFQMHNKHRENCITKDGQVLGYGDKSSAQRRLTDLQEKHKGDKFQLCMMAYDEE